MSRFAQRTRPQSYISSWIVNTPFDSALQYLLIAGGGSGGASSPAGDTMAGGGAGGYISSFPGDTYSGGSTAIVSSPTNVYAGLSVSVVIGGGGPTVGNPGDGVYYAYGTKGTNSTITIGATTITAYGGEKTQPGGSGVPIGSGAGTKGSGGGQNTNITLTQGSAGYFGGGGAGTAAAISAYGAPGNGLYSLITGVSVARGGGGGGGTRNAGGTAHLGGLGGGGNGAANSNATSGAVNTGGGGGGAAYAIGTGNGGGGGSGVCIFNYPTSFTPTIGAGLTGTVTNLDGRTIIQITAGSGNITWA